MGADDRIVLSNGTADNVLERRAVLAKRAARFSAEAKKPPPPLPKNRMTVWSGKVTRSDKDAALAAFVARKARLGEPLNEAQQRAAAQLSQ